MAVFLTAAGGQSRQREAESRELSFCWQVGQVVVSWEGWLMVSQMRRRWIFLDQMSVTRWMAWVVRSCLVAESVYNVDFMEYSDCSNELRLEGGGYSY